MFKKPVFIVNAPRSGSTLLFTLLCHSNALWSVGREPTHIWNHFFHPRDRNWSSDAIEENEAEVLGVAEAVKEALLDECRIPLEGYNQSYKIQLLKFLKNQGVNPFYYDIDTEFLKSVFGEDSIPDGPPNSDVTEEPPFIIPTPSRPLRPDEIARGLRYLEKTPRDCYRIPFILRIFPDALFIFITRDGKASVNSLIEGWRHSRWFFSYKLPLELKIHGYSELYTWGSSWWNFLLPPGWEQFINRPLEEVCAFQWRSANEAVLKHMPDLIKKNRLIQITYEQLVENPVETLRIVAEFVDIPFNKGLLKAVYEMPIVMATSRPAINKWKTQNFEMTTRIIPQIQDTMVKLGYQTSLTFT